MSTKHTPGPWKAVEVGMSDSSPSATTVFEVLTADGYRRVCEYVWHTDACLIAAAPDLFAIVSKLASLAEGLANANAAAEDAASNLAQTARVLVAKATGSTS